MTTVINPLDYEDAYDHIILAGVKSPGQVTISGHDRKAEWDIKNGVGLKGATTNLKSIPPVEITCSFYLLRDDSLGVDDLEEWPAFLGLIKSSISSGKPKALDIYHPDLADVEITSVCLSQIGGKVHDGKGGQTVAIKFLEYRPAKAVGGAPSGSKKDDKPDPDAAAKAEIARLTAQYQATPWG